MWRWSLGFRNMVASEEAGIISLAAGGWRHLTETFDD